MFYICAQLLNSFCSAFMIKYDYHIKLGKKNYTIAQTSIRFFFFIIVHIWITFACKSAKQNTNGNSTFSISTLIISLWNISSYLVVRICFARIKGLLCVFTLLL